MKYFLTAIGGFFLIVLIFVFSLIGFYNSLITQRTEVQTQRAQTETQLQRRFDLIPSLVGAVKGAMKQEQKVFDAIAKARTQYAGAPSGSNEKLQAAGQYESAISRLLVVMENYPQLKSIDTVQNLMTQLEGTENRISVARQRYNESVQTYNNSVQYFPGSIIANIFGFSKEVMFKGVQGSEKAPVVNLE